MRVAKVHMLDGIDDSTERAIDALGLSRTNVSVHNLDDKPYAGEFRQGICGRIPPTSITGV